MNRQRAQRVADLVRRELAQLLQQGFVRSGPGMVTVTDVRLSPDLRHARVFVTVLGGDGDAALRAVVDATPRLRRELARRAGLRYTPALTFVDDDVEASGRRIDAILDTIRDERVEPDTDAGDGDR